MTKLILTSPKAEFESGNLVKWVRKMAPSSTTGGGLGTSVLMEIF